MEDRLSDSAAGDVPIFDLGAEAGSKIRVYIYIYIYIYIYVLIETNIYIYGI